MCEEALSSVCVVNKILCLFNQNQTVLFCITWCREESKHDQRHFLESKTLQVGSHRACTLVFASYYDPHFLFLCLISWLFWKSVATPAWWAVGRPDFKAFFAVFALRRTCQSVTDDAINMQHVCLCATVATEPCIIGQKCFRRIQLQERADHMKAVQLSGNFRASSIIRWI